MLSWSHHLCLSYSCILSPVSQFCFKIHPESDFFPHHFPCYTLTRTLPRFLCIITIVPNWSSCCSPCTKASSESGPCAMLFSSCHATALEPSHGINHLNFMMTPSYPSELISFQSLSLTLSILNTSDRNFLKLAFELGIPFA